MLVTTNLLTLLVNTNYNSPCLLVNANKYLQFAPIFKQILVSFSSKFRSKKMPIYMAQIGEEYLVKKNQGYGRNKTSS